MLEAAKNLLLVFSALIPIVDPLGGSPFFLALTGEYAPEGRKALSWRIAVNNHPLTILAALIGFVLIALSIFLCYGFADRLARMLGPTAMLVIVKLSSLLLVCIGVQIAWNGVKALLESVVLHTV